jgi:hypothetical protein
VGCKKKAGRGLEKLGIYPSKAQVWWGSGVRGANVIAKSSGWLSAVRRLCLVEFTNTAIGDYRQVPMIEKE